MHNKMDHPLITVDGRTLMDRPLEPPNFVVDTLLAQGLHLLAGSPKVGKSWLALWLAVTVAKGEPVWNMSTKQGTTLYLCLEDSVLRIQNRLFEITEDAPDSVHFCTECALIGQGLEEQVDAFIAAHPDTVLVIIDTLQMVRPIHDATYANDYRDLSVLKRLADKHGIAILLIHHLRKEKAEDVFHRISGTTAISGAVDSSFTLVEEKRGSGRARLTCVGRDIEYRELELRRSEENVWELVSDSREEPVLREDRIVVLISAFMSTRTVFIGTPTELSEKIDPDKLVNMIIKPLLPFLGAPYLDSVIDEPLYYKGCLILFAAKSVKHKDQQNIKFSQGRIPLNLLDSIPVFGRDLETGDTFFRKLRNDVPALFSGKFVAPMFLHGDIVFFYLSFCRNAIKTVDPLSHGRSSLTCTPLEVGFLQNLSHQTGNSLVGLFVKDEPDDQTLDNQFLYALSFCIILLPHGR